MFRIMHEICMTYDIKLIPNAPHFRTERRKTQNDMFKASFDNVARS